MLSLVCFLVGGLLGWGAAHGGPHIRRVWPVVLRVQILVTSATLSFAAAWRLTSAGQLVGPLALAAGLWLMLGAAQITRGPRSAGEGALEAWAVSPNSGFWVVPAAAAFAGSTGTMIAVLANVITSAWGAVVYPPDASRRPHSPTPGHDLGRPVPDPRLRAGLAAPPRRVRAPGGTADVLTLAGPLLAFSGAALFTGSVIHPHNLGVPRTEHALRRWSWLTALRVAYYLVVAVVAGIASSTPLVVVAVLSGLSAPSFQPIQLAVLYGYRCELVVSAVRWGWLLAPLGLGLAAVVR